MQRIDHFVWSAFALFVCVALVAPIAIANDRIALVVGNNAYQGDGRLDNPVNDAKAIANALKDLNFKVTQELDLDQAGLRQAIRKFQTDLSRGAKVGFFYFAGHAVQINGNNYLIPVDANFAIGSELLTKGYDIRELLDALARTPDTTNVIVLDSCRNNPFAAMDAGQLSRGIQFYSTKESRPAAAMKAAPENERVDISRDPGLGRMDAPINTLIAYSTKPGFVALDGDGRNSPYTQALVKMMQQEGVHISQVFADVRREVYKQTGGQQMPWESSSLTESFIFKERKRAYASPY